MSEPNDQPVIPAQAGIRPFREAGTIHAVVLARVPAFAGMTECWMTTKRGTVAAGAWPPASRRVGLGAFGHHRVERGLVGRGAELSGDAGLAEMPRDAGERLQVIGAGALGREQEEDEVDRLVVERLEIDRLREPREQAEDAVEARELAVRDGDAAADAGRAELLALQKRIEDLALRQAGELGRLLRDRLDRLLLALALSEPITASGLMRSLRSIIHSPNHVPSRRASGPARRFFNDPSDRVSDRATGRSSRYGRRSGGRRR